MFRRKKKEEETSAPPSASTEIASEAPPAVEVSSAPISTPEAVAGSAEVSATPGKVSSARRGNRVQKVGIVFSDKMQKTVVVRVDRLVLHQKYRRYVRRTSKFKAHDDLGSAVGDRVRIVETRPLSAQKRWRVVEILQKAAK